MILGKIQIDGTRATRLYCEDITRGIIGAELEIEYIDPVWDDLTKTVVFHCGGVTKDIVTDALIVTIPTEVVQTTGMTLSVGIYGTDANGNLAIPTICEDLGCIRGGANPSGDTSTDPTLPVWAQLQSQIDELREHPPSSGLPSVTEEDNGKMLLVENSEWKLVPSSRFVKNTISISSFTASPSQAELGSKVAAVTLKWAVNMTPTELYLDDVAQDVGLTSLTDSTERSSNKTWTLKAVDDQGESATKSATLSFLNGAYYGAAAQPESIDSTFILGLSKTLTSSRARTITVNAGTDQHIWYAVPARLGACKFAVGGFEGGFDLVETLDFTNASGYRESYYVYRSGQTSLGETRVVIS